MRTFLKAIAALLPLAAFTSSHALAADGWRQTCSGPAFVCGSAAGSAKASSKLASKPTKPVKVAKHVKSKRPAADTPSAWAPVKAKKKYAQVKTSKAKAVVEAPAKAKKAKFAKASSGGATFQTGVASWYGGNFHGRKTANGETYNMNAMTAAHKTLPFGTRVRVTNTRNGDTVDVRINDRGPFIAGRVIDLSRAAASDIGVTASGVAPVKLTILGKG